MSLPVFTRLPKYYSTSRELRNKAEKQRREKLKYHLSELSTLVPFVTGAQRKVDKISVLRLAASYIRLHKVLANSRHSLGELPSVLSNEATLRTLLNSIGGFLLVLTSSGKVVFVSEAIEDTFEYTQSDILGRCFYSMIHPDDIQLLRKQLESKDSGLRLSFYCRLMKKEGCRSNKSQYEIIHIVGQLKRFSQPSEEPQEVKEEKQLTCVYKRRRRIRDSTPSVSSVDDLTGESSSESIHEQINVDDEHADGDDDYVERLMVDRGSKEDKDSHILISFVQVVRDRPITEISLVESTRDEYITRHGVDGNILHVDHRISYVTGLMPEEVIGKCAFDYMHEDDVLWSIVAQKQMLGSSQGQGIVTYRLHCKDNTYVMLRSRGFLEVNKDTGKIESFICINTMLGHKDGEVESKTQRKKLLISIKGKSPDDVVETITYGLPSGLNALVKCLINRQALERMLGSITDLCSITGQSDASQSLFAQPTKNEKCFPDSLDEATPPKDHKERTTSNDLAKDNCRVNHRHRGTKVQRKAPDHAIKRRSAELHPTHGQLSPRENLDGSSSHTNYPSPNKKEIIHSKSFPRNKIIKTQAMSLSPALLSSPPSPNVISDPSQILYHPNPCTSNFTPEPLNFIHPLLPSYSQLENWGYPAPNPESSCSSSHQAVCSGDFALPSKIGVPLTIQSGEKSSKNTFLSLYSQTNHSNCS